MEERSPTVQRHRMFLVRMLMKMTLNGHLLLFIRAYCVVCTIAIDWVTVT